MDGRGVGMTTHHARLKSNEIKLDVDNNLSIHLRLGRKKNKARMVIKPSQPFVLLKKLTIKQVP